MDIQKDNSSGPAIELSALKLIHHKFRMRSATACYATFVYMYRALQFLNVLCKYNL